MSRSRNWVSDCTSEIDKARFEIAKLQNELLKKELHLKELLQAKVKTPPREELTNDEIAKFSRQLIMPDFGVSRQLCLRNSSFLIVGVGGLGCPAAQYLVAAGCGRIGLLDYDAVEQSNTHRQTFHTEPRVGMLKVESARLSLRDINGNCTIDCHAVLLNSHNCMPILTEYDVVLDCTDNVPTRYLLNDACVMLRKPLVSGSALQTDGQLTVYNYGECGPCYRCIYPVPPPPDTVTNCSDGGVLGAITGTIGSLQALEAMKIACKFGEVLAGRMTIFDGARGTFRNIKLRSKRPECAVCSDKPIITQLIDYEAYCGFRSNDSEAHLNLISNDERISVGSYDQLRKKSHLLIDVRPPWEFEICRLPSSQNIPIKQLLGDEYLNQLKTALNETSLPVIIVCRRGNDSQLAVQHLRTRFPLNSIRDIIGGLRAWHRLVDHDFPIY